MPAAEVHRADRGLAHESGDAVARAKGGEIGRPEHEAGGLADRPHDAPIGSGHAAPLETGGLGARLAGDGILAGNPGAAVEGKILHAAIPVFTEGDEHQGVFRGQFHRFRFHAHGQDQGGVGPHHVQHGQGRGGILGRDFHGIGMRSLRGGWVSGKRKLRASQQSHAGK